MIPLIDRAVEPVLWLLADWSIRWGILIVLLAVWFRVHPPRSAATRHLACALALVGGLALPLAPSWTTPWPRWSPPARTAEPPPPRLAPVFPPEEPPPPVEVVAIEPDRPEIQPGPGPPPPPASRPVRVVVPNRRPLNFGRWVGRGVGVVWLAGVGVVLARLAAGGWFLARLRREARPLSGPSRTTFEQARRSAAPGRRAVAAATHPSVGSPVALGGWSPLILLPTTWVDWPQADQRAALLHELAHLARGDDAWKLAATLVRAPGWFHPGIAWLAARLDREAELAADEATVAHGVAPRDLARLLLDCARNPHRLAPRHPSALSFFTPATISTRINRLLEDDMPHSLIRTSMLRRFGLGSLIAGLVLAIGGARGGVAEPPRPPLADPVSPTQPKADPALTLIVRDVVGQPVAGVTVLLRERAQNRIDNSRTVAEAQTDAAGKVEFTPPSEPGAWVVAFKEGYCFVVEDLPAVGGRPSTTLTLPPGRQVAGKVQDPDGKPIEGAEVSVSAVGRQGAMTNSHRGVGGTQLETRLIVRTGPDGRFQFDMLPDQPRSKIQTTAAGRATLSTTTESKPTAGGGQDPTPITITLPLEGRVQGRVVAAVPGVGINGRQVVLEATDRLFQRRDFATTDAGGRFEFAGLPATQVRVTLDNLTADHPFTCRPVSALVRSGQTTELTVELIAGTELNGSVTTADGKPVGGLSVSALFGSTLGPQMPLRTTTSAAGAYQFRVSSGPVQLHLDQFQASYSVVGSSTAVQEIIVPEGVAALVVAPVVVAPVTPLIGKLTDAVGAPIEGAQLLALTEQQFSLINPTAKPTVTDAEGRFRLEKLTDGQVIPAEAGIALQIRLQDGREFNVPTATRPDGLAILVKLPILQKGGPPGLNQVAADEVAGVVVDPQGQPIAGVMVSPYSWTRRFLTRSDRDGQFRIKVPGKGKVQVKFTQEDWEPREILDWTIGEANRIVVLDNKTYFTGRVLAPDGSPVADAPIRANQGPRPSGAYGVRPENITTGQSGPDGRYRLYVEPGVYEFQVRAPGRGVLRLPRQAIATDEPREVNLTLAAGVTFEARVVNSLTGAPVAGFLIEDWRNRALSGTSNADGVVTIPSMMPGRFLFGPLRDATFARWWSDACMTDSSRFQAMARNGFQRNFDDLDFNLQPGMAPVTIQLEPAAIVRGVVLDPDGQPVAGATVADALTGTGNSLSDYTRFSVATDASGQFTAKLPASGQVEYNLIAHDGEIHEFRTWANAVGEPFATTPGQVIDGVTLRLTRPATVTGQVIDAGNGQPMADCEVQATGTAGRDNRYYNPTARTGTDGSFTLRGIRPGAAIIKTAQQGVEESARTVTLTAGETHAGIILKPRPMYWK